jgi:hypothetical protein
MEGGGIRITRDSLEFADIGDYKNLDDSFTIAIASLFTMWLGIILARTTELGSRSLNSMFDTFGLEAVLGHTSLVVLLFFFARYLYTAFYSSYGKIWSPFIFLCVLLIVQMAHDLLMYYGVLQTVPFGKNELIDSLKEYAKENSTRALAANAAFFTATAGIAMITKDISDLAKFMILVVTLYAIPYSLSIIHKKVVAAPPPPPPKQKETMRDIRGLY